MPWTITRLCIDCVDTGCVSVCPVDCIYEYVGTDKQKFPNMLYIAASSLLRRLQPNGWLFGLCRLRLA